MKKTSPEFMMRSTADELEITSPMPIGTRIFFLLAALIPWMAPYELLIRTRWENFANVFFLAAAVISAGAMAVSAFCGYAAVAGLESRTTFHRPGRRFTHSTRAPVVPLRTKEYSVESIAALEVVTHDWSDGPSSYSFEVVLMDGRRLNLGSSWSKAEAEEVRDRAAEYLHPSS